MRYSKAEEEMIRKEVESRIDGIADEMLKQMKYEFEHIIAEDAISKIVDDGEETINYIDFQIKALEHTKNKFLGQGFTEFNKSNYEGILWNREDSLINDPDWRSEHLEYLE